MEALGRLLNLIPIATGAPFKVRGASGVLVWVTGATAVITMTASSSFGGSYTNLACIKNVYWTTATNGTAAWSKLNYASGVAPFTSGPLATYTHGTTTGLTTATLSVFHVFTSEFSDPTDYLQATATGSGACGVIPYDLVSARGPANLEILGS
jgi:putative exporter of polyketide antibiotics